MVSRNRSLPPWEYYKIITVATFYPIYKSISKIESAFYYFCLKFNSKIKNNIFISVIFFKLLFKNRPSYFPNKDKSQTQQLNTIGELNHSMLSLIKLITEGEDITEASDSEEKIITKKLEKINKYVQYIRLLNKFDLF